MKAVAMKTEKKQFRDFVALTMELLACEKRLQEAELALAKGRPGAADFMTTAYNSSRLITRIKQSLLVRASAFDPEKYRNPPPDYTLEASIAVAKQHVKDIHKLLMETEDKREEEND